MCGKPNPGELDTCQFCGARLKPLINPSPDNREPLRPGDIPVKKDTAEFEGTGYRERMAGQGPIVPGDMPTKKDTAELERALPAWLRQARNPDQPLDLDSGEAKPDEGPASASESGSASAGGLPDWLADLASGKESKLDTGELLSSLASPPADEGDVPGWLSDLRGADESIAFGAAPESEDSLPETGGSDWLSRLNREPAAEEPSSAGEPPKAEEGTVDWLNQLQSEPEGGEEPAAGDDLSAWLSGLDDEKPAKEPPAAPVFAEETPAEEAAPDWLKDLQTETPEAQPAEEGELPSWLSGLASETTVEEPPAAPVFAEETPAEEAAPGWLKGLQTETPEAQPAEEGDLPSWLSGLASEPPAEGLPTTRIFDAEPPVETPAPDWLKDLQSEISAGEPAGEKPAALDDMPDWFKNMQAESAARESAPEEETPSWLGELESTTLPTELPAVPAFETDVPPADETPDWLNSLKFEVPEDLSAAEIAKEESPARETGKPTPAFSTGSLGDISEDLTPDWLTNLQSPGTPAEQEQAEVQEGTGEELPSWMSGLGIESAAVGDETPSPFPNGDTEEDEPLPPWLSKAAMAPDRESEDSQPLGTADVFAAGVPDWLSAVRPTDDERPVEMAPADSGEEDLRPADLPNWVQAMRPVEDAIAEAAKALESERPELEQHGPLAGISGILPAGVLPTGTPRNTSRLQVTNTQQVNVGILEAVLSAEAKPKEVKRAKGISSLRVLRILVALILILTVGLSAGLGSTTTPAFSSLSQELFAVRNWVDTADLSAAPVLLVFDYEAALSGELEAAAAPVLDHLAIRGAKLATVSTSPTGPALADRQMRTLQVSHTYQPGQNYVNLGYLPGGPAGILAFAQRPASVGGELTWGTPVLAGTRELDGFAAIFIITDNVETGQQWIEQTTGARGSTQLFLVVSAQAEPMLHPYYQSGQVSGMVSGLAGGASYEANLNRPGSARRYWDAFSLGLLVSVIMIVLGAGWSLLSTWMSRPGKDEAK
jgi:hypothetical protein